MLLDRMCATDASYAGRIQSFGWSVQCRFAPSLVCVSRSMTYIILVFDCAVSGVTLKGLSKVYSPGSKDAFHAVKGIDLEKVLNHQGPRNLIPFPGIPQNDSQIGSIVNSERLGGTASHLFGFSMMIPMWMALSLVWASLAMIGSSVSLRLRLPNLSSAGIRSFCSCGCLSFSAFISFLVVTFFGQPECLPLIRISNACTGWGASPGRRRRSTM